MDIAVALSEIATPVGMYHLLQFLETNGENATVRPWMWIIWLLFAPTIRSIAFQWSTFIAVRILDVIGSALTLMGYRRGYWYGQKASSRS